MKHVTVICLVLCACAYTQGAISPQNNPEKYEYQLTQPSLHLHAGSNLVTEDDQLLAKELTELERSESRNVVADTITNMLESFRDVIIYGNDDLPPLDPLLIDHVGPFEHSGLATRVTANIRNFNMAGLRWYTVDYVTVYTLRLAIGARITIPWLVFTGSYDASARIALLSHEAGGNFRVFINRVQTTVDLRLGTNILGGGTVILRELDIDIVIHDISIQIDGLVGSSLLNSLINSFIQNSAQNLLRDELAAFSEMLSTELFDTINEFLGDFTINDLLS